MLLSESIRLGAMLHPQAFGYASHEIDGPRTVGDVFGLRTRLATCAIGAALEAGYTDLTTAYGTHAICPERCAGTFCGAASGSIPWLVMHLNDDHRWTRERIAEWVATVEPADEPVAPLASAEAVSA